MNFEEFKNQIISYFSKKNEEQKLITFENNEEKNYVATFNLKLKNGKSKHCEISYDGEWLLIICDYYPNATPRVQKAQSIEDLLNFVYDLNVGDIGE